MFRTHSGVLVCETTLLPHTLDVNGRRLTVHILPADGVLFVSPERYAAWTTKVQP